jgi:hypothetical protein
LLLDDARGYDLVWRCTNGDPIWQYFAGEK